MSAKFWRRPPEGVTEITNAQAFTLAITHSGDEMCAQMIKEVPIGIRVRDNRNHPFLVIYRTYWGFPETLPELSTDPRGQIVMKGFLE